MEHIPEEHPMMQHVLRFLLVYSLAAPEERSQCAQEFATGLAAREQNLLAALQEIERHHVEQNHRKGRDESRSHTLQIARAAIAKANK